MELSSSQHDFSKNVYHSEKIVRRQKCLIYLKIYEFNSEFYLVQKVSQIIHFILNYNPTGRHVVMV